MKRWHKIIFLVSEGVLFILLFIVKIDTPCFFKTFFHIPCLGCGMTTAFRALFRFQIIESFSYHILALPLFIFLVILNIKIICDLLLKKDPKVF